MCGTRLDSYKHTHINNTAAVTKSQKGLWFRTPMKEKLSIWSENTIGKDLLKEAGLTTVT